MSNKKAISQLLAKLKICDDPIERDEIEEQILVLAEQDEIEDMMKYDDNTSSSKKASTSSDNVVQDDLDPREKIRLERANQRDAQYLKYKADTKLDSKDEELLRQDLMNQALATNDDYAFQKKRNFGAKNKTKKFGQK